MKANWKRSGSSSALFRSLPRRRRATGPREKPAASIGGVGVSPVALNLPDFPIEGKISKVAADGELVQITVGTDSGLMKGQTLHVFRTTPKPEYLGQIRLTSVGSDSAVGVGKTSIPMQPGDIVSSKVGAVHGVEQTFFVNDRKIKIPVHVDPARRQEIAEIVLFVSKDHGKTYEQACKLVPDSKECEYAAPCDGDFWFQVQTVDRKGELSPKSELATIAPLRVCVDTTIPVIQLNAVRQPGGIVKTVWIVTGSNLDPFSLVLEYRLVGTEDWKSLGTGRALAGTLEWKPGTPDPVESADDRQQQSRHGREPCLPTQP